MEILRGVEIRKPLDWGRFWRVTGLGNGDKEEGRQGKLGRETSSIGEVLATPSLTLPNFILHPEVTVCRLQIGQSSNFSPAFDYTPCIFLFPSVGFHRLWGHVKGTPML